MVKSSQLQSCLDLNCDCCTSQIACTTVTAFNCQYTHSQILLMKNQQQQTLLILITAVIFVALFIFFVVIICYVGRNSFKLFNQRKQRKKLIEQEINQKKKLHTQSNQHIDVKSNIPNTYYQNSKMKKISESENNKQTDQKSSNSHPYSTPQKKNNKNYQALSNKIKNESMTQTGYAKRINKKSQEKTTIPKRSLIEFNQPVASSMTYIMKSQFLIEK